LKLGFKKKDIDDVGDPQMLMELKIEARWIILGGSLSHIGSAFAASLTDNFYHFIFLYGILSGFGVGLIVIEIR